MSNCSLSAFRLLLLRRETKVKKKLRLLAKILAWLSTLATLVAHIPAVCGNELVGDVGFCYQCGLPRRGGLEDTYCENARTFAKDADKIPRHQVFNLMRGEAARQSCHQRDMGIKVACPASPTCLTVAAKVCIGTWKLGSCDKKSFWCWQKSCVGDPKSRDGMHLDHFNRPEKIPGCKVRYNVSRDDTRKILIEKAVFCLCDSDGCNTDLVDLTGKGLPYDGYSQDDIETEEYAERSPASSDISKPDDLILSSGAGILTTVPVAGLISLINLLIVYRGQ